MAETFGIDVSRWQGNFDFAQAKKEGVKFVIIKCGGGDGGLYKDSKFERNYDEARKNGLGVGAYFFGHANTTGEARDEANYCIDVLRGKKFDYPIFYDVEAGGITNSIVQTFCNTLEAAGYWCGFYTNLNWYDKIDGAALAKRYSFWLANWSAQKPNIPNVQMWQFGGETNLIRSNKVAGVVCDQSYCYVDYPAMIKAAGKNGYDADEVKEMTEIEKAEKWAVENGLFIGYSEGNYGWQNPMTREQLATVLYRFYNELKNGKLK